MIRAVQSQVPVFERGIYQGAAVMLSITMHVGPTT